ncbi:hypothetical protein SAMN05920897_11678 [Alkalispirochaeta americana]|uniref:NHL repeat-containing protein n=1 Tax=Alkalispirochaeta americana TaxID=159291 RepID=A0A1N6W4B5_9SPIO|nr:hypothetical protein [Alkalispirochaeta americana]SIQ84900.1 hypothetical protein SAMN05920897_11678 [Alkalispirochaeta americana]
MMPRGRMLPVALAGVVVFLLGGLRAEAIDMDAARAQEEFRWGVEAYHATRFSDAIVAFTRALAFKPEDPLAREWLGRAFFRSGFEDAAVNEWDLLADRDAAGAYLLSRLEVLQYRRGIAPFEDSDPRFSRSHLIRGGEGPRTGGGDVPFFQRPTGAATDLEGNLYLVSLATQEILKISPNGRLVRRFRGGFQSLNRPFDVQWHQGKLFVTEFGAHRVAILDERGNRIGQFGERGLGEGQMVGPQYLALDGDGHVYVTDWGRRRVSVFSPEGEYLLSFGGPSGNTFSGLHYPAGIALRDGRVYVADRDTEGAALVVFDTAGNHLERIPLPLEDEDFSPSGVAGGGVEGLAWYDESRLLVAAGRQVLLFDPLQRNVVTVIDDAERKRVGPVAVDANGRILVGDIDGSEVALFEPEGTLYSGLDVQIEQVLAGNFPRVALLVAVHDRAGRPLVGLSRENFVISERAVPRQDLRVEATGSSLRDLDLSVILQPLAEEDLWDDSLQALSDLLALLPAGDPLGLYIAGSSPELLLTRPATEARFLRRAREGLHSWKSDAVGGNLALDSALRLAAVPLLERGLRRNIVFVGDGSVSDTAFDEYGLQEVATFLRNNAIRFHCVLLESRSPAAEIRFLVEETGGTLRYLYEPEGLAPMLRDFQHHPSGRYWLTYTSEADSDFGRVYLPVSAEARLFVRSGRDEMGYFPPSDR